MIGETRLINWAFPEFCSEATCKQDHSEYTDEQTKQTSRFHVHKGVDGKYSKEACYYLSSTINLVGKIVIEGQVIFNEDNRTKTTNPFKETITVTTTMIPTCYSHKETFDRNDLYSAQIKAAHLFLSQFILVPQLGAIIADYCWGDSVLIFVAKGYSTTFTTEYELILQEDAS